MEQVVVAKKKTFLTKETIAKRYFNMIAAFIDVTLQNRELDLLIHIAITGTISSESSRLEFLKKIGRSNRANLDNLISQLYKKQFLIKVNGKISINPSIYIDFQKNDLFKFSFTCLYKDKDMKI